MISNLPLGLVLSIAILGASPQNAPAAEHCMAIGGVAIANFFAEGEGQPIVISATLTGSVQSTAGKILAQRETPTGLEMDMEHYFQRDDGGHIHTRDLGVLTAGPGKPGRYMIEITYEIQPQASRGSLRGYAGSFRSYGLVDLRDPNDMQGLVRYRGDICR